MIPYVFLEFGTLFHKWRPGLRRKFLTAPREKFQKKGGKTMVVGAVNYAREAELFFEPLFCHLMSFRGEGEMDREIAEANDLGVYFLESESEG